MRSVPSSRLTANQSQPPPPTAMKSPHWWSNQAVAGRPTTVRRRSSASRGVHRRPRVVVRAARRPEVDPAVFVVEGRRLRSGASQVEREDPGRRSPPPRRARGGRERGPSRRCRPSSTAVGIAAGRIERCAGRSVGDPAGGDVDLRPDLRPLARTGTSPAVSSVTREVRRPGRPAGRRARPGRSRTRTRIAGRPRPGGGPCSTTTRSGGRAARRRAVGRSGSGRRGRAAGGGSGRRRRVGGRRCGEDRAACSRRSDERQRAQHGRRRPPATRRAQLRRHHQFHLPSSRIVAGTSSARTTVASRATAIAMPIPSALMRTMSAKANEPRDDHDDQRRRGHDPAAPLEAAGDRLGVVAGLVPDLLHPRQQEHLVVHRQPEQHAEEDHGLGRLHEAERLESEHRREVAVLEDPDERAEADATIDSVFMTSALIGRTAERSRRNRTM